MDTTVQALQNLYVALGGELTDVETLVTIPDMINAIAVLKTASAASEETPSETPSDEPDVPTA